MKRFFLIFATFSCFLCQMSAQEAKVWRDHKLESEMAKKIIRDNPGWKRTLDNFSLYRKPGGLNLWICGGEIRNLSALAEYDFNTAWLLDTSVDDLSFLRNSKSLIQVVLRNTKNNGKILDLSGIKGKPVASLYIDNISIKSIEPVVNMKFRGLKIRNTKGASNYINNEKRGRVSPRTSKKLFFQVVLVVSTLNSNIPTFKHSNIHPLQPIL